MSTFRYGEKGVADSQNWPPYRSSAFSWKIAEAIYIFGGQIEINTSV